MFSPITEGYAHAPIGRYRRLLTERNPYRISSYSSGLESRLFNHMWHLREPKLVSEKYAYIDHPIYKNLKPLKDHARLQELPLQLNNWWQAQLAYDKVKDKLFIEQREKPNMSQ